MSEINRETDFMPLLNQMLRVFLTLMIAGSILLSGCSYIPWVGNDDDELALKKIFRLMIMNRFPGERRMIFLKKTGKVVKMTLH